MSYSLNELYSVIGVTKQAVHAKLDAVQQQNEIEAQLLVIVEKIRADHPTMGVKGMYYKILPENMGRDKFEDFCNRYGFKSKARKRPWITTDSTGVKRFDNLVSELKVIDINQVWASDITYYEVKRRYYYLTFVIDVCSRYLKGYSVSQSLRTSDTTLPALNMALKTHEIGPGLIFHTDGGGQYYSNVFLELTGKYRIRNSMCKEAYENPFAERINGTIKNNYLNHRNINTYKQLQSEVDRAVQLYNHEKPHKSLQYSTPYEVEKRHKFDLGNQPKVTSH